jgi:two-component system CheB/CheR fusion protein
MTSAVASVLIVDDDFDIREVLVEVLRAEGFEPTAVQDGLEALEYLRCSPLPRVILLDWMMPRCDGATFRREQLKDERLSAIPVVLLTADTNSHDKGPDLKLARILRKPVRLEELVSVINGFCRQPA